MTEQEKKQLSDQLRAAIAASKLSPYEIAKQSGVNRAALSRFLSGERGLSLESVEKLAPVLGIQFRIRKP